MHALARGADTWQPCGSAWRSLLRCPAALCQCLYLPNTPQVLHWTEVFTSRLSSKVKMVGSVISCEGSPKDGNAAGEWRNNPYVLPYAWATDKVRSGRGGAGSACNSLAVWGPLKAGAAVHLGA